MAGSRFTESEIAIVRRAYARQLMAVAGIQDERIERAFATVRREAFLGTPPWQIVRHSHMPSSLAVSDPICVYQDQVIALTPQRGVNNGSPSLHTAMLHDLAVVPGQRIAQIGAGGGYYTAILAELAGPSGRITAYEFDPALAERARRNLEPWPNVTVVTGDGASAPDQTVDGIYVNFAVAAPAAVWLEQLAPGGRLLFPLGAGHPSTRGRYPRHSDRGAVILIERQPHGYAARHLYPAFYVCAEGGLACDADVESALFDAFERSGIEFIKSLRWKNPGDPARCWFWTAGWSLSYDAVDP